MKVNVFRSKFEVIVFLQYNFKLLDVLTVLNISKIGTGKVIFTLKYHNEQNREIIITVGNYQILRTVENHNRIPCSCLS